MIEIENGNTAFSNIMCKYTGANGDTNFTQFTTDRGTASSGVNSFVFVSGEGRWAELVGQMYRSIEITSFEENMKIQLLSGRERNT